MEPKTIKGYKVTLQDFTSKHGNATWEVGKLVNAHCAMNKQAGENA